MTETQRKAMQQALETIDWLRDHLTEHHACLLMNPQRSGIPAWVGKTEAALRAALAEPEPEPVAWADKISFENAMKNGKGHDVWPKAGDYETRTGRALIGIYTTPPTRKPLTEEEINDIWNEYCDETGEASINDAIDIGRAIERKITGGNDE